MTTADILANLCQYDPRNPDHEENPEKWAQVSKGKECYCDNCHNGKTALAEELLKTRELLEQATEDADEVLEYCSRFENGEVFPEIGDWLEEAKALFPFGADEQPARSMEALPDYRPAENDTDEEELDQNALFMIFGR